MILRLLTAMAAASLLLGCATLAAESPQYLVESELWADGERKAAPMVVVEAGAEASIETSDGESGWRLSYEVEKPRRGEGAGEGAIWLQVGIHELVDGRWDFITDSMLGIRIGHSGTLSVVDEGVENPTPENSRLYLRVRVQHLEEAETRP